MTLYYSHSIIISIGSIALDVVLPFQIIDPHFEYDIKATVLLLQYGFMLRVRYLRARCDIIKSNKVLSCWI